MSGRATKLRWPSNEATLRAFRNAHRFTTFEIFRRPGPVRRRIAPSHSGRSDRIGRPNGAGKSTLFALLLGDVSPDKGTIAIEKNATIGFLPQETAAAGDETVLELACSRVAQASSLQIEEKRKLEAYATFDEHGGWELEPKAKRVLAGLAFRETDFDRPARALMAAGSCALISRACS